LRLSYSALHYDATFLLTGQSVVPGQHRDMNGTRIIGALELAVLIGLGVIFWMKLQADSLLGSVNRTDFDSTNTIAHTTSNIGLMGSARRQLILKRCTYCCPTRKTIMAASSPRRVSARLTRLAELARLPSSSPGIRPLPTPHSLTNWTPPT
jgi:hypothetical protein